MQEWQPISEEKIWDKINDSWSHMDLTTGRFWEVVKIAPDKWTNKQKFYGHGSWVVALMGGMLIWYDDLEEGFRSSYWTKCGIIDGGRWGIEGSLQDRLQDLTHRFGQT
jgi:hypothetical protein